MPREIHPLTADHDRKRFECGKDWLNRYLRNHALRNQELGYGRTFVAVAAGSLRVDGYSTLSMGSVMFENLPPTMAQDVPRYPMPVVHMGCLAVARDCQRQRLGEMLLVDALRRAVSASNNVAMRAVEVKAIDEEARDFYLAYGFVSFVDHPLHLYLPMATIHSLLT
jgi:ribosomal protein S18 acetylase RimI-like enzyme